MIQDKTPDSIKFSKGRIHLVVKFSTEKHSSFINMLNSNGITKTSGLNKFNKVLKDNCLTDRYTISSNKHLAIFNKLMGLYKDKQEIFLDELLNIISIDTNIKIFRTLYPDIEMLKGKRNISDEDKILREINNKPRKEIKQLLTYIIKEYPVLIDTLRKNSPKNEGNDLKFFIINDILKTKNNDNELYVKLKEIIDNESIILNTLATFENGKSSISLNSIYNLGYFKEDKETTKYLENYILFSIDIVQSSVIFTKDYKFFQDLINTFFHININQENAVNFEDVEISRYIENVNNSDFSEIGKSEILNYIESLKNEELTTKISKLETLDMIQNELKVDYEYLYNDIYKQFNNIDFDKKMFNGLLSLYKRISYKQKDFMPTNESENYQLYISSKDKSTSVIENRFDNTISQPEDNKVVTFCLALAYKNTYIKLSEDLAEEMKELNYEIIETKMSELLKFQGMVLFKNPTSQSAFNSFYEKMDIELYQNELTLRTTNTMESLKIIYNQKEDKKQDLLNNIAILFTVFGGIGAWGTMKDEPLLWLLPAPFIVYMLFKAITSKL